MHNKIIKSSKQNREDDLIISAHILLGGDEELMRMD